MIAVLAGCLIGAAQGVRHAFEPDHLAAVSTVVAEQKSGRASLRYAAAWGAGHALVLSVVGGTLFALRRQMPERLGESLEVVVAAMLVALGVRALRKASLALTSRGAARPHVHLSLRRPVLIGVVHGLAGSGALTALVMAKMPSIGEGLLFMALYGAGAMLGMALLAGAAGAPLARFAKTSRGLPVLLGVSGSLSLVVGALWGWTALAHVLPMYIAAR